MKQLFAILGIALASITLASCGNEEPEEENNTGSSGNQTETVDGLELYQHIDCPVRDLALIYQGAKHRIDWTEEEITPYVTHKFALGGEEWLFDGFLFLDFCTDLGDEGRHFCYDAYQQPAVREDYEWYLDRLFEKNKSLDALNKVISKKKQTIGAPGFKHKIALTVFEPKYFQTNWGELNGKKMDFSYDTDRIAVCEWFINELITRFEAENYENLELYAIYQLQEDAYQIETISAPIKKYCQSRNLDYIWIPYFKAYGIERWKPLGFDQVYHQPNHYFTPSIPDERLDEAIEYSREIGIGMEFECDEYALSQLEYSAYSRMVAYVDYFEKHGVWYDMPIAYYTGNHLFLDFTRNASTQNTLIFDRVCRHIVNRRLAAQQE